MFSVILWYNIFEEPRPPMIIYKIVHMCDVLFVVATNSDDSTHRFWSLIRLMKRNQPIMTCSLSLWLKNERGEKLSSNRSDNVTGVWGGLYNLSNFQEIFLTWVSKHFQVLYWAIPENIHTHPMDTIGKPVMNARWARLEFHEFPPNFWNFDRNSRKSFKVLQNSSRFSLSRVRNPVCRPYEGVDIFLNSP